ncbi:MAG: DUF465 domain-containing protein [Gammaproteobacteria bacterium]|jgi:hypothetical protein|nr:DUF465 domain-containing protein [Gammaproteobacteria bacterium]
MDSGEDPLIRQRIAELLIEHRDLDDAIQVMESRPYVDQLQLRRLKKRKLLLKDSISKLESQLIPDMDA